MSRPTLLTEAGLTMARQIDAVFQRVTSELEVFISGKRHALAIAAGLGESLDHAKKAAQCGHEAAIAFQKLAEAIDHVEEAVAHAEAAKAIGAEAVAALEKLEVSANLIKLAMAALPGHSK